MEVKTESLFFLIYVTFSHNLKRIGKANIRLKLGIETLWLVISFLCSIFSFSLPLIPSPY